MASSTAQGDIGVSDMRMPKAWLIALAMAGTGGIMDTSPTPLTPVGWSGLGTSTIWVSIMGRSLAMGMR